MKTSKIYYVIVALVVVFLYYCHGDKYLLNWHNIKSEHIFSFVIFLCFPFFTQKILVNKFLKNQLVLYCCLLILLFILYIPYSLMIGYFDSSYLFVQFINLLLLFFLAYIFSNDIFLRQVLRVLPYGVILAIILNIYDITRTANYFDMGEGRATFSILYGRAAGFYLDPNVSAISILFGLIITYKIIHKKFRLIYFLIAGCGIILTLSLAGIFAYFVFIYLQFIHNKIKLKYIFFFISIFILLSISIRPILKNNAHYFGPGNSSRVMAILYPFDANLKTGSTSQRLVLLKNSVNNYLENPIFGGGIGKIIKIPTYESRDSRAGEFSGPHNQWLAFMIDFGILGIFYFAILFFVLRPTKLSANRKEVVNFLIILFIYSLFSHTLFKNHSLIFLLPLVYQLSKYHNYETKNG